MNRKFEKIINRADLPAETTSRAQRVGVVVDAGRTASMGAKKKYKKRRRELEARFAESTTLVQELVADARARTEERLAELDAVAATARRDVEAMHARLHGTLDETELLVRAVLEQAGAQRTAVEAAHARVTGATDDLDTEVRAQIRRVATTVEDELARLEGLRPTTDQQLAAATERALVRIETAVDDELARLEGMRSTIDERLTVAIEDASIVDEPEEEHHSEECQSLEAFEAALVPSFVDDAPMREPEAWASELSEGRPSPIESPVADLRRSDSGDVPTADDRAFATGTATVTAVAPAPTGNPITFQTSRAQLRASLVQLRRTAADGWVRVEPVHRASPGEAVASLRLTVQDIIGGFEYHEVPGRASAGSRRAITVDAAELLHAVECHQESDDGLTLTLDGDITIGAVLVPGQNATLPILVGERRKVERIQLHPAGRDGLALDTLAGRFVVPSRVVSSLRSRRASAIDLVTIGDQPCLSARIAGPTEDILTTIELPLGDATALHEGAAERREADESPVGQLVGALSTGSSPDELVAIIANGVGYARRRAASHPALPEGIIADIVRDGTESMRSAAASNPNIPVAAIERAVADEAPAVRAAVAAHPRVPPALLFQLLRDDSAQVRVRVAHNPALPPEMLALLAADPDAKVRAAVAAHQSCPLPTLVELSSDTFPGVCARVAENPRCPVELLEQLLSIVPDVVLSNPRTPEHVLVAGTKVSSAVLRAAVAGNPSTPARELHALTRDPDRRVVHALAANPNAPSSLRRRARRRSERGRAGRTTSDGV
jgi:hypothetical protein